MYKRTHFINHMNGIQIVDHNIYTFINESKSLCEFSAEGDLLWHIDGLDIYFRYHILNTIIVYATKNKKEGIFFLDRKTKKLLKHEKEYLNITNAQYYHDNRLYSFSEGNLRVYDVDKLYFILTVHDPIIGRVEIITNSYIISHDTGNIYIYRKPDFALLWQKDLSEEMRYEHEGKLVQGEIKQVKQYKNTLIVVSDGGIIRLALETGELLWKTKTYAQTMEIVDVTGYVCTGLSLYKINLDTGEISGYGWENNRLPDIQYQGKNYWPAGDEVIYHQGLLWYAVYISGKSFLVAINPYDGHYEWIHYVNTNEKIESPKFHGSKMFLLDTGGTLHIYEKEN